MRVLACGDANVIQNGIGRREIWHEATWLFSLAGGALVARA